MAQNRQNRAAKAALEQKLIELVKLRPCIYNTRDINHKNAIVVENAWMFIFEQIGGTDAFPNAEGCSEMWKNLWSQFLAFKRRLPKTTGSGGGRRPSFRHELSMQYFEDTDRYEDETVSNVQDSPSIDGEDGVNQILDPSTTVETSENGLTTVTIPSISITPTTSATTIPLPTMTKSRSHKSYGDKAQTEKRSFNEQLIDCLKTEQLDEYQHFCSGIAIKLKKINGSNKKIALETQKKIQDVVFDAEMEILL